MIVMKFGGTSVQDAQAIDRVAAIVRERLPERPAKTSTLANALTPDNDPAPEARTSLAPGPPTRAIFAWRGGGHPEASNAKPEGWVGHKTQLSPVGAAQEGPAPRLTANEILSPKLCPTTRQVSGHEVTRAVQPKKNLGFSPCDKTLHQGLKAKFFLPDAARLKSYPDTCLAVRSKKVPSKDIHHPVFLRASVPPWWRFSR
jgi:hypothetical protein